MKEINVLKKKVKHYRVVIKKDGTINVTVPYFSTKADIDKYIESIKPWIEKNYDKALDESVIVDLKNEGSIYIFGDKYNISIIKYSKNLILMDNGTLYIETKNTDIDYIKKNLSKDLLDLLIKEATPYINKYLNLINESINKLTFKMMKSAYGKCYYERKEIILSKMLVHKPKDFIEAVCLHEVAHLKYHNHQKEFYALINKYMSDYKIRLKHLKND